MGTRNTRCRAWPVYSWVICSSMACLLFGSAPNSGRGGFANLEIDGAVLDLNHGVVVELAVEGMEVVVGGAGAVVVGVLPVHVVVVDEAAIEEQAAMGLERARHHVGRIGMRAPVGGRAHTAFGIGLQDQTAQIGNGAVELVSLGLPPRGYAGIERIESIEPANCLGAAEIHRQRDANAPGAKRRGDARHCGMKSAARTRGSAFTLLMEQPLMPSEASRRA